MQQRFPGVDLAVIDQRLRPLAQHLALLVAHIAVAHALLGGQLGVDAVGFVVPFLGHQRPYQTDPGVTVGVVAFQQVAEHGLRHLGPVLGEQNVALQQGGVAAPAAAGAGQRNHRLQGLVVVLLLVQGAGLGEPAIEARILQRRRPIVAPVGRHADRPCQPSLRRAEAPLAQVGQPQAGHRLGAVRVVLEHALEPAAGGAQAARFQGVVGVRHGGAAAAAEHAVQPLAHHLVVRAHRQVVAQRVRRGRLLRQPQQRLPPGGDHLQALLVAPQPGQLLDALVAGRLAVSEHFRQRLAGGRVAGVVAHHLLQPVAGFPPTGVDAGQGLVILQRQVRRRPGAVEQRLVTGHGGAGVPRLGEGTGLHKIAVADLFAAQRRLQAGRVFAARGPLTQPVEPLAGPVPVVGGQRQLAHAAQRPGVVRLHRQHPFKGVPGQVRAIVRPPEGGLAEQRVQGGFAGAGRLVPGRFTALLRRRPSGRHHQPQHHRQSQSRSFHGPFLIHPGAAPGAISVAAPTGSPARRISRTSGKTEAAAACRSPSGTGSASSHRR